MHYNSKMRSFSVDRCSPKGSHGFHRFPVWVVWPDSGSFPSLSICCSTSRMTRTWTNMRTGRSSSSCRAASPNSWADPWLDLLNMKQERWDVFTGGDSCVHQETQALLASVGSAGLDGSFMIQRFSVLRWSFYQRLSSLLWGEGRSLNISPEYSCLSSIGTFLFQYVSVGVLLLIYPHYLKWMTCRCWHMEVIYYTVNLAAKMLMCFI